MIETLDRSKAASLATTHRLVGFGAGELGLRTLRFLGGHVAYFVDNERGKWGDGWEGGVPVRPVEALRQEDAERLVVIACTEHLDDAARQLAAVQPGIRLLQTPLLRHHEVFDGLLRCSTRLLATAYGAAGGLYLLDGCAGTHRRLLAGSFRGMAVVGHDLVVATDRGDLGVVRQLEPPQLDLRWRSPSDVQAHGLAYWASEHRLLVAEARTDAVAVHDASTFERVGTLPVPASRAVIDNASEADRHHVNDLLVVGDRLLATTLSVCGWWQYGVYDGAVLEIDLRPAEARPIMTDLCFPHSIRLIDDRLCLLESMLGALHVGGRGVAMRFPGFVRGLAGTTRCLYVGQSRHRRLTDARGQGGAVSMDSGVYVADAEAAVFRFLKLPELCDVYDLMDLETTAVRFDDADGNA